MKSVFARSGNSTDFFSDKFFYVNNCGYNKDIDIAIDVKRPAGRSDYQLLFVESGKVNVRLFDETNVIHGGEAYVFCPGEPQYYSTCDDGNTSYYWIHFSGYAAKEIVGSIVSGGVIACDDSHAFVTGIKELVAEVQFGENVLKTAGMAMELIALFCRQGISFFDKTVGMMNRDIDNGVFDRDWAKISGLSKYYFIRLFREKCGKTPHAYFCDLRMERAKFLLTETHMSIGDVAAALGYNDRFYFSTVFKKSTGSSPRAYRTRFS